MVTPKPLQKERRYRAGHEAERYSPSPWATTTSPSAVLLTLKPDPTSSPSSPVGLWHSAGPRRAMLLPRELLNTQVRDKSHTGSALVCPPDQKPHPHGRVPVLHNQGCTEHHPGCEPCRGPVPRFCPSGLDTLTGLSSLKLRRTFSKEPIPFSKPGLLLLVCGFIFGFFFVPSGTDTVERAEKLNCARLPPALIDSDAYSHRDFKKIKILKSLGSLCSEICIPLTLA